jgi:hypothetical protein
MGSLWNFILGTRAGSDVTTIINKSDYLQSPKIVIRLVQHLIHLGDTFWMDNHHVYSYTR